MLKLQINWLNTWYDLQVDDTIIEEVLMLEKLDPMKYKSGMIEVADFPSLAQWMRKHAYRQAYVMRTHIPDIKVTERYTDVEALAQKMYAEHMTFPGAKKWDEWHECVREYWRGEAKKKMASLR